MSVVAPMIRDIRKSSRELSCPVKVMLVLYSIFGAVCWSYLITGGNEYNVAKTITGCILLLLVLALVFTWFSTLKSKIFIMSSILGLLLSIALIIGSNIEGSGVVDNISALGSAGLTNLYTYLLTIGLFPICSGGISSIYLLLLQREKLLDESRKKKPEDNQKCFIERAHNSFVLFGREFSSGRLILLSAVTILLCWIPVLLIMFPGVNGYDSAYQINQFITGNLDSKHPVLHTLFLGACISLGQQFSSNELGILIYSIIQMSIMALIFGLVCRCVMSISRSQKLFLFALLWFALCPINSVFSISVTKDVLFAGFVILSMCLLLMITREERSKLFAALIVSLTLMLLFRNNAAIAYAGLLAGLAIWALKSKRLNLKWGGVAVLPLVLFWVIVNPISSFAGVTNSSNTQESLSVPLQQLARTAVLANDLSQEDKEMIDSLVPDWENYQAGISDLVKNSFNSEYFKDNAQVILSRYIAIGFEHPQIYLESFLINTYGYWYPDTAALNRGGFSYHPYFETPLNMEDLGENYYQSDHACLIPLVGPTIEKMYTNHAWEMIPGLATLMNSGAVVWLYLIVLGYLIMFNKNRGIAILLVVFFILYWATCVLGPCLLVRYIYPLFAGLPLVLSCLIDPLTHHNQRHIKQNQELNSCAITRPIPDGRCDNQRTQQCERRHQRNNPASLPAKT